MFQPNADPSVQYDFARIDLAKKKEFIEKAFAVQRNHIEQMPNHWIQELFLYTLEKGYRNYRENMIADLNDQKLNLIEFKKFFSKFFTYDDFEEITQRYWRWAGFSGWCQRLISFFLVNMAATFPEPKVVDFTGKTFDEKKKIVIDVISIMCDLATQLLEWFTLTMYLFVDHSVHTFIENLDFNRICASLTGVKTDREIFKMFLEFEM